MSQKIKFFPNRISKFQKAAAQNFRILFRTAKDCPANKISRSVGFLRGGLGFIYLWFGALKFFPGLSSAEKVAGATIELMTFGFLTPPLSMPLLALWETAIGVALLSGKFQRAALFSLFFHVAGTLTPLVLLPEQTWSAPPFAASLEGQYIFKNIITLGAALVIIEAEHCGFFPFSKSGRQFLKTNCRRAAQLKPFP